jgi:hypothetical protein
MSLPGVSGQVFTGTYQGILLYPGFREGTEIIELLVKIPFFKNGRDAK